MSSSRRGTHLRTMSVGPGIPPVAASQRWTQRGGHPPRRWAQRPWEISLVPAPDSAGKSVSSHPEGLEDFVNAPLGIDERNARDFVLEILDPGPSFVVLVGRGESDEDILVSEPEVAGHAPLPLPVEVQR